MYLLCYPPFNIFKSKSAELFVFPLNNNNIVTLEYNPISASHRIYHKVILSLFCNAQLSLQKLSSLKVGLGKFPVLLKYLLEKKIHCFFLS